MSLWFANKRLDFVREGCRLFGAVGRSQLVGKFQISQTQAGKDLEKAAETWPRELRYDRASRQVFRRVKRQRRPAP